MYQEALNLNQLSVVLLYRYGQGLSHSTLWVWYLERLWILKIMRRALTWMWLRMQRLAFLWKSESLIGLAVEICEPSCHALRQAEETGEADVESSVNHKTCVVCISVHDAAATHAWWYILQEVLVSSNAAFMLTHMSGESCTVQKGVARYLHFEVCSVPLPHQQNVLW